MISLMILERKSSSTETPISYSQRLAVKTLYGDLVGARLRVLNTTVHAFYGIPYASPPKHDRRFAVPLEGVSWRGIREAGVPNPYRCPQLAQANYFDHTTNSSTEEDCLFMDIYTPSTVSAKSLKPVIVVLHGGSFQTGSNRDSLYDGRFFAAIGDVVVCVPNYRLNVFGFLKLRNPASPGNQGLWDQYAAIRWVNANAHSFGGKKSAITLLGVDSGAVSAGLHLMSPMSRLLFNRVIMQGGSPFYMGEYGTFAEDAEVREFSKLVCANLSNDTLNRDQDLSGSIHECLRGASPLDLLEGLAKYDGVNGRLFGPFYGENMTDDLFISHFHPDTTAGKITPYDGWDLLIGYTVNEGEYFVKQFLDFWSLSTVNQFPKSFVRVFLERLVLNFYSRPKLGPLLERYFDTRNGTSNLDTYVQSCNFLGDVIVKCPSRAMADYVSNYGGNVFVYELDFDMESIAYRNKDLQRRPGSWHGATHYADALLSLGRVLQATTEVLDDAQLTSRRLIQKWSAFARTGYGLKRNFLFGRFLRDVAPVRFSGSGT